MPTPRTKRHTTLARIALTCNHDAPDALAHLLLRYQGLCALPESAAQASADLAAIHTRLAREPDLHRLLLLRLVTDHLLCPEHQPPWAADWLRRHVESERLFPDLPWDRLTGGQWRIAKVPLALEKGRLCDFVVGLVAGDGTAPQWPPWADGLLDADAIDAVTDAAAAADRFSPRETPERHFYLYPLFRDGCGCQLTGRSLGLPLALAFAALNTEAGDAGGLVATGVVAADGTIRPVGHLGQKIEAARNAGANAILVPDAGGAAETFEGIEVIRVATLAEAWAFRSLYQPGNSRRLQQFTAAMTDGDTLARNIDTMDVAWIRWAGREGRCDRAIEQVLADGPCFERLRRALREKTDAFTLDAADAIRQLVPKERLAAVWDRFQVEAFRWATANIALSNHRGRLEEARYWSRRCRERARAVLTENIDAWIDYVNNDFVTRHNGYRFHSQLEPEITRVIGYLEKGYTEKSAFFGGELSDRPLGAFYGTIAQNYAFCGPAHLVSAREYAARARRAFGQGTSDARSIDILRQHYYELHALLDAHQWQSAEVVLLQYLGAGDWDALWERLPPPAPRPEAVWPHTALARFLADTGVEAYRRRYGEWTMRDGPPPVKPAHPYQLWLLNLGRIAARLGDTAKADACFRRSLDLCRAIDHGRTIRVMGLMPLAALADLGTADPAELAADAETLRDDALSLNPDHFQPLRDGRGVAILTAVAAHAPRLFPFTYR